jgi:hypothetical protein
MDCWFRFSCHSRSTSWYFSSSPSSPLTSSCTERSGCWYGGGEDSGPAGRSGTIGCGASWCIWSLRGAAGTSGGCRGRVTKIRLGSLLFPRSRTQSLDSVFSSVTQMCTAPTCRSTGPVKTTTDRLCMYQSKLVEVRVGLRTFQALPCRYARAYV